MKLWIDDQINDPETPFRHPTKDFVGVDSVESAIDAVTKYGYPNFQTFKQYEIFVVTQKIVSIFEASSKNYFIALARESRVCAIELFINGEEFHPSFLKHGRLTNSGWKDIGMKHLNYSKFKTIHEVGEWSAHIMLKTYQNWNQDKVMHVWKEKADYIRNWMES
jgi:hypothetical protein